jgi:hypothetical protein
MRFEPVAAESALIQLVLLDHRAHRAVQHDDPLLQQPFEALDPGTPLRLVGRNDTERGRSRSR